MDHFGNESVWVEGVGAMCVCACMCVCTCGCVHTLISRVGPCFAAVKSGFTEQSGCVQCGDAASQEAWSKRRECVGGGGRDGVVISHLPL